MKITVYTITTCQFSKQEREYLASHGLQYEEKNLEMNREFLSEMLTVGNNFAGTPVTKIEKDDGQIVVLKGFTKEEFDKALGFEGQAPAEPATAPATPPVQQAEPTQAAAPAASVQQPEPAPAAATPPAPVAEPAPAAAAPPAPADPAMASILTNLEQKASTPAQPSIPDPKF